MRFPAHYPPVFQYRIGDMEFIRGLALILFRLSIVHEMLIKPKTLLKAVEQVYKAKCHCESAEPEQSPLAGEIAPRRS